METKVAIFWDIETCPIPERLNRTHDIFNKILSIAETEGRLTVFNAYTEDGPGRSTLSPATEAAFELRAVTLVKCVSADNSSVFSRITTDSWAFVHDIPPGLGTLIYITALAENPNFIYCVSQLRRKSYKIVLVAPSAITVPESLRSQVPRLLDWDVDIILTHLTAPDNDQRRPTSAGLSISNRDPNRVNVTINQGKRLPSSLTANRALPSSKRSSRTGSENQGSHDSTTASNAGSWRRSPASPNFLLLLEQRPLNTREIADDIRTPTLIEKTKSLEAAGTYQHPHSSSRAGDTRPQNTRRKSNDILHSSPSRHLLFSELPPVSSSSASPLSLTPPTRLSGDAWPIRTRRSGELHPAGDTAEYRPGSYHSGSSYDGDRKLDPLSPFSQQPKTASPRLQDGSRWQKPANFTQAHFLPLIQELEALQAVGDFRPLRSLVGSRLGRDVYARAGAAGFNQYAALAEQAGLVQLGGSKGTAWISLGFNASPQSHNPRPLPTSTTSTSKQPID